jgi:CheY-like chemotaxis protein
MRRGKLNIFLVEDDELDVMNVQRSFADNSEICRVYVASDGVEALDMLHSGAVPLDRLIMLVDLNMPRMNGIELLRALRSDPALKSIPVVILSTSDDERDKRNAYHLNVAGYVIKPITLERHVECIKIIKLYWSMVEFP